MLFTVSAMFTVSVMFTVSFKHDYEKGKGIGIGSNVESNMLQE